MNNNPKPKKKLLANENKNNPAKGNQNYSDCESVSS